MPTLQQLPNPAERSRLLFTDSIRRRALERLYQRRNAVCDLIDCLEDYQKIKEVRENNGIRLNAVRRCS
jgi:hypothetical protein